MAEVLGVVSSGIAVVGLAGQVAKQAIALKQLWDEVKGVPEGIRALVTQLELLHPVLADMETSFLESPEIYNSLGTARQSMEYCNKAIEDLSVLTSDLSQDVDSAKWLRKSKSRIRIVLKKDQINTYRERLQNALQLLGLSQQIYLASLIRIQPQIIATTLESLHRGDGHSQPLSGNPSMGVVEISCTSTKTVEHGAGYIVSKIPWRPAGYFGGVRFESSSQEGQHGWIQEYFARIQLPFWLASTTWDFHVRQACNGWQIFLRSRTVRPFGDDILHILKEGSSAELFRKLIHSSQGLHDSDERGNTLLHHAILRRRADIAIDLVRQGARLDERNMEGFSAFRCLCIRYPRADSMQLFRYLDSTNQLDDLATHDTPTSLGCPRHYWPAIEYARLSVPGLFSLISKACGDGSPQLSWTSINWHLVEPKIMIEMVEKRQTISLRQFQTGQYTKEDRSVSDFIRVYFRYGYRSEWPSMTSNAKFEQFRVLCRLAFKGASAEDLSPKSKRHSNMTPLMYMVYSVTFRADYLIKDRRRKFLRIFCFFLQDLKTCGIDLEEYGSSEWCAWRSCQLPCLDAGIFTSIAYRGPRLASFSYGPEPKDWSFELDYFTPEYARGFWDMVEEPPPPSPSMPGAWVEHD